MASIMTEDQARSHAEAFALAMGITFYIVWDREGRFLSVQMPPQDCEIVAPAQREPTRGASGFTCIGNIQAGQND
jgi:hypothetical protein